MKASYNKNNSTGSDHGDDAAFIARRKRITAWKYGRITIFVVIIAGLSYLDRHGYIFAPQSEFDYYQNRSAMVVRVIDGDTVDIDLSNKATGTATTRVRLWGIDCPETAKPAGFHDRAKATPAEPFADAATSLTRQLVMGKPVILHIEAHRVRGYYGRLLAYLVIPRETSPNNNSPQEGIALSGLKPDETTLSAELLRAGFARADNRWPHSLIHDYQIIETEAQQAGVGLWGATEHDNN